LHGRNGSSTALLSGGLGYFPSLILPGTIVGGDAEEVDREILELLHDSQYGSKYSQRPTSMSPVMAPTLPVTVPVSAVDWRFGNSFSESLDVAENM
jgi:hypothetical protein